MNGALFIFSFFRKDKKAGVEGGIVAQKIKKLIKRMRFFVPRNDIKDDK
ncbi:hypothetical protein [Flavobacterium macrobrachii]